MKLNRIFSVGVFLLLGAAAWSGQERQFVCKSDELYRYIRVSIEKFESTTALEVRGLLSANDPRGIELAVASLSHASVRENANELKVKGQGYNLKIDFKSGEGKLSYGAWDSNCWPGESEWCVIRVPTYNSWSKEMHSCQKL